MNQLIEIEWLKENLNDLQTKIVDGTLHMPTSNLDAFEVFKRNLPLIDLRVLCNKDEDYANPIEPSCIGGLKIAKTIKKVIGKNNFATSVYVY